MKNHKDFTDDVYRGWLVVGPTEGLLGEKESVSGNVRDCREGSDAVGKGKGRLGRFREVLLYQEV